VQVPVGLLLFKGLTLEKSLVDCQDLCSRNLEILKFLIKLLKSILQDTFLILYLIISYRIHKGNHLDIDKWHPYIKWKSGEGKLPEVENDATWNIQLNEEIISTGVLNNNKIINNKSSVKHQRNISYDNLTLNKAGAVASDTSKKSRVHETENNIPTGLTWDSRNYSCAFDSIITVLYHVWKESDNTWKNAVGTYSKYMQALFDGFEDVDLGNYSLKRARNSVHTMLNKMNPQIFPFGHRYTDITELSAHIMGYGTCGGAFKICPSCGKKDAGINVYFDQVTLLISTSSNQQRHNIKLSDTLDITLNHPIRDIWNLCDGNGLRVNKKLVVKIDYVPALIMFECWSVHPTPEAEISISTNPGLVCMRLCGLIYTGDGHFNSRVFDQNGSVEAQWYE